MFGRVLVVEESPSQLHVIRRILERRAFEVLGAETAQQAFLMLTQSDLRVDLVVVERDLSDLSGVKLFELVKGVLEDETPPFVLISGIAPSVEGRDGVARPARYEQDQRLGFADSLAKPLSPRRFPDVVDSVITGGHKPTKSDLDSNWIEAARSWARAMREEA